MWKKGLMVLLLSGTLAACNNNANDETPMNDNEPGVNDSVVPNDNNNGTNQDGMVNDENDGNTNTPNTNDETNMNGAGGNNATTGEGNVLDPVEDAADRVVDDGKDAVDDVRDDLDGKDNMNR